MGSQIVTNHEKAISHIPDAKSIQPTSPPGSTVTDVGPEDSDEIFQINNDGVNFRTVSWQRATVIFTKIQFAMSILAIPEALAVMGAVPGTLSVIAWTTLNTCVWSNNSKQGIELTDDCLDTAVLIGDVRSRRHDCHCKNQFVKYAVRC